MEKGDKAAIVACSNGLDIRNKVAMEELVQTLTGLGIEPVMSDFLYDKGFGFSGTGRERARALMDFYKNDEIKAIFDVSGGDVGNEVLPYLHYDVIAKSSKMFWGYSDLTTIINGIYAKTGKPSVLYQVRNLIGDDGENQIRDFRSSVLQGNTDLFDIPYKFVQGDYMEGIVVGGNIRCLLKLAGTEFWPDMRDKILLLEARSGRMLQMVAYVSQLKQLGVFEKVNGVLLGTFTELERNKNMPHMKEIILDYVGKELPVAYTDRIGHGADSKGIVIGRKMKFYRHR